MLTKTYKRATARAHYDVDMNMLAKNASMITACVGATSWSVFCEQVQAALTGCARNAQNADRPT